MHINLKQLLGGCLAFALVACGGGGSSSTSSASQATTQVAITDAPSSAYSHAWITLNAIWFHASDVADPDDAGWIKFPLATTETVDLVALANGNLAQAFSGLNLPVGRYLQIRLFLADSADPLTSSASAAGLSYNDEIDYTDSTGAAQQAPLELVAQQKGIGLLGTFTVTAGTAPNLALDFDVGHDVLQFDYGSTLAFLLKPRLVYFDLAHVGAIVGKVVPAALASTGSGGSAYDLVIKAETLSDDGTYHRAARFTTNRADGSFTLFPLYVPDGATSTTYDVLVRGRDMETIVIKNVPVIAGTGPATGQSPTSVQTDAIALTTSSEYTANLPSGNGLSPTGGNVRFYQTLPGSSELPYEVRYRTVDPFTGSFFQDIPLSSGSMHYGSYNGGADVAFAAAPPQEGAGNFDAFGDAPFYTRTAANQPVTASTAPASSAEPFTIPQLAVSSPATADSISGNLSQAIAGKYDSGYLMLSHFGDIVTTIPLASILAQNSGAGGNFTISNLPGGSSTTPFPPGLYYLSGRVWNSSSPRTTVRRSTLGAVIDLRSGSASNVSFVVN